MVGLFGWLGIAVFGVVGVGLIAVGASNLQKWQRIRNMDPGDAAAIDEGIQELEGRARAVEDTITAPFTGTESLVCKYKIEQRSAGGESHGSGWHPMTNKTESVPFEVERGGETVAVDPENAQCPLTREFRLDTSQTDEYPPGVQEHIENENARFKFTERRLDEGEEVYVLGPAERTPSAVPEGSDAQIGIRQDAPEQQEGWREVYFGDPFVVVDAGEEQAKRRYLKRTLWVIGIGVVLVGIAVVAAVVG